MTYVKQDWDAGLDRLKGTAAEQRTAMDAVSTSELQAAQDITVSLPSGVTFGKYSHGQVIPAAGKTFEEVLRDAAIADIAPTYTPATIAITQSATALAEVGGAYTNNLNAVFTKNDAGDISALRIAKNGSDLTPNGTSATLARTDSSTYPLGAVNYIAYANYADGAVKNYSPSGTPDARTPAVRNVNAPQAAENNFASATVTITGEYKLFSGPVAASPANSTDVRALPSNRFTGAGNTFTLTTGTTEKIFAIAMPATMSLVSVVDLDALSANITANYVLSTFSVNDAGGTPVSYKVYILTNAVPYPSSHSHQVTVA